jgi:uncharacterized protein (TIGR03083 family)
VSDPREVVDPERPDDAALIAEFRAGAEAFVDILRKADPSAGVWTWSSQHDVAFVIRHQVQEAAVHRWDAQNAIGRAAPIEQAAAIDSIEEFLTFSTNVAAPPLDASVVLEATNADAAWTVADAQPGLTSRRGDTDATARVRGTVSDLLLWLYARVPTAEVASGDLAILDRFRSHLSTD